MTDFIDFCRSYGVLLDGYPPIGRWIRVKTEDKPKHRNGAVKFMGDFGVCQNWATMEEPAIWRGEAATNVARRGPNQAARHDAQRMAEKAARKAARMLAECSMSVHPYFARKGFPEHLVNVRDDGHAIIPMHIGRELVGCQVISADGDKKFLYGQRSGGAEFVMGQHGQHFVCEGYATALSVQEVLRSLKTPYVLHVAFSAGNMRRLAQWLPAGIVIADNDVSGTGERVALEIGWPYWMSSQQGEDFNDTHQRIGTFALAMQLRSVLTKRRVTVP